MPIIHHRQFANPFSNLFPTDTATTTTPAAATTDTASVAASSATQPTTTSTSDLLGGITSAIGGIIPTTSTPSTTTTTSATIPSTTSVESTPATTTSPTTTQSAAGTQTSAAASASSASASASASAAPSLSTSSVAAGIIGGLIGALALALIISFILRRWNRHRNKAKARESMFNTVEFPTTIKPKPAEQKGYVEEYAAFPTTNLVYQPEAKAAGYASEYGYGQQQPVQIYSPHPQQARGYPSAAQQIAYAYQGGAAPVQQYEGEQHPNPHPAAPAAAYHEHDAYGGMS
ncbi:hypothetical protein FB451DRAFT_1276324 [Mycena latifolia]|nr:hypothetical protein FB451DRAFT_1276324 [Mycena latifolia]